MKLTKGDRVKYNGSIYVVEAVLFSTIYLGAVDGETYKCTMDEVQKNYRDIEIISEKGV